MSAIHESIYNALINDSVLIALVPEENIRRGLQDSVEMPSIRFYSSEMRFVGDDISKNQMLHQTIVVTILGINDLELEEISSALVNALSVDNLTHDDLVFHSCMPERDMRGTFFDPIRKVNRKDISFFVVYSPANID
jgi:hypothetical protein